MYNRLTIMKLIKVTQSQLSEILYSLKSNATFGNIVQYTDAKLLKTPLKAKGLLELASTKKLTKLSGMFNNNYEKAIVTQLTKEGKTEDCYNKGTNTMPLEFGTNNQIIGKFRGEDVIQYRPFANSKPITKFVNFGKIIDKDKLKEFLPTKTVPTNQGTDTEILWRKVYLKNIRRITINGQTYKLLD